MLLRLLFILITLNGHAQEVLMRTTHVYSGGERQERVGELRLYQDPQTLTIDDEIFFVRESMTLQEGRVVLAKNAKGKPVKLLLNTRQRYLYIVVNRKIKTKYYVYNQEAI